MSYGGSLIRIDESGRGEILPRAPLSPGQDGIRYDEAFIEKLIYSHPETLPIEEIDSAYRRPVPVCTQLVIRSGILDILMITPDGRIVIVEAKLWRNPESKRKVVGQILDYAAELSRWSYEDLQREVSKRRPDHGESLFNLVAPDAADSDEPHFVDELTRSLRQGRFLLLICGDGIREDLATISQFLERYTTLDFTFGLVEFAIFEEEGGACLVQPRVLAKSLTLKKQTIEVTVSGEVLASRVANKINGSAEPSKLSANQEALKAFWSRFAAFVQFDDPEQDPPNPVARGFVTLRMPIGSAWITLYLERKTNEQGVFLTFNRGEPGDTLYETLLGEADEINLELPSGTRWRSDNGKHSVIFSTSQSPSDGERIEWLANVSNDFVNAFRPRIERIVEDL